MTTKSQIQIKTEVEIKNFVKQIEKMQTHYNECNKIFVEDRVNFLEKIIDYAKQNKNHLNLAKDIGFPEHLVAHIVSCWVNDGKSDESTRHILDQSGVVDLLKNFVFDRKKLLGSFEDKQSKSDVNVVNIGLDDASDFTWADNMWIYNVPCNFDFPEGFSQNSNFDVHSKGWSIYLRLDEYGKKNYLEASSDKEKFEIAEMLRLMGKYLGY
jgi:hypothetical protein